MKLKWIYQLRGLAILAVVVCHQQWLLHTSELIQTITLFSVTSLIFLLGVTSGIYLKKKNFDFRQKNTLLKLFVSRTNSVVCTYVIASCVYLLATANWNFGLEYSTLLQSLLKFNASGPLYFIKYYLSFIFISPILFAIIIYIKKISNQFNKILLYIILSVLLLLLGCYTFGRIDFFGGSYLMVFALGMICSVEGVEVKHKKSFLLFGSICLVYGFYATRIFYYGIVEGTMNKQPLDNILPIMSINPPSLSIILYSFGIIIIGYAFFNALSRFNNKFLNIISDVFAFIGIYSLDIYIWHILVQYYFKTYFPIENMWSKRIVYYLGMILIPILAKKCFMLLKNKMIMILESNHEPSI